MLRVNESLEHKLTLKRRFFMIRGYAYVQSEIVNTVSIFKLKLKSDINQSESVKVSSIQCYDNDDESMSGLKIVEKSNNQ